MKRWAVGGKKFALSTQQDVISGDQSKITFEFSVPQLPTGDDMHAKFGPKTI